MLDIIISTLILVICGYLIAKNYDAKFVLFGAGLLLMYAAVGLGHTLLPAGQGSGIPWFDPFVQIKKIFISQMGNVGLTIMVLFGFSSYMSRIGANEVTVLLLTRPLSKIRSPYLLVPVIFLLGNLLSLVVPSAASLAVLLMATLYPVLKVSRMSSLTAGAVIATTATIMPSPLGADNVLAAQKLGIPLVDYIVTYHAPISLPTLGLMAVVHYFWQKTLDKRQHAQEIITENDDKLQLPASLPPAWYGLFPVLPLVLVLVFGICFSELSLGLVEITFLCLLLTIAVELLRKGNIKETSKEFSLFFSGMGTGLAQVVSLIVAASILVEGLKAIGIIDTLVDSVKHIDGVGSILMFFFSGIAALIGFISGSGLAVFYSFINIIPEITEKVGVNSVSVALPMQLTANLIRSMSPVAAVIIVVASITGSNPIEIIKRTSVPVIAGIISCMTLSWLLFS